MEFEMLEAPVDETLVNPFTASIDEEDEGLASGETEEVDEEDDFYDEEFDNLQYDEEDADDLEGIEDFDEDDDDFDDAEPTRLPTARPTKSKSSAGTTKLRGSSG